MSGQAGSGFKQMVECIAAYAELPAKTGNGKGFTQVLGDEGFNGFKKARVTGRRKYMHARNSMQVAFRIQITEGRC